MYYIDGGDRNIYSAFTVINTNNECRVMHHWHKLGLGLHPFGQLMLNLHQSATELVGEHVSDIFAVAIECVFGDRDWCENCK